MALVKFTACETCGAVVKVSTEPRPGETAEAQPPVLDNEIAHASYHARVRGAFMAIGAGSIAGGL